ncbi:hypothetical protein [Argonema antarcticum]|nr:hypothetical protein [Argonema antarcticum]
MFAAAAKLIEEWGIAFVLLLKSAIALLTLLTFLPSTDSSPTPATT